MRHLLTLLLAATLVTAGCGKVQGDQPQPAPSDLSAPATGSDHPFERALEDHGFGRRFMTITYENTAKVNPPPDAGHCTVVIEANMTSLSDYKVASVGGTPLAQLPPALRSKINRKNINADDLWEAIQKQRDLGTIHC